MINQYSVLLLAYMLLSQTGFSQNLDGDIIPTEEGDLIIQPVLHGSLAFQWGGKVVFVDPYGGADVFGGLPTPDLVLITDIHGDHMNIETLEVLDLSDTKLIVPQAVADKLPEKFKDQLEILVNGGRTSFAGMSIMGLPMYNLPESSDSRHTKGRGNGYAIIAGGKKLYFSGDTEDIPEMRGLKGVDVAFVCMNMPYTMEVGQAADAVLDFEPKIVYPYHYRGKDGLSDVDKFKQLVNSGNSNIEVRLRNWYPN